MNNRNFGFGVTGDGNTRLPMTKTAVVILNWNGIRFLKQFLKNIYDNSINEDVDIYVADNGSTDNSVAWIRENHKEIKLLLLDKNYGFAEGYNRALAKIEAEYYVLLNSDIEVAQGWLEPLISFMDRHQDVASAQPKILSYAHKDQFEYAGAAGGFIDRYGYPLCRGRILNNTEQDNGQYDKPWEIFWASGACTIIRSSSWKETGGFDGDFFAHMEEIDLCWRFHLCGYKVALVADSTVYHVGGGTLPYNSPFKTYLNFRNSLYLLYKNLPERLLAKTLIIRTIFDIIAFMFFCLKGQFKSASKIFTANKDFYKNRKRLKEKRNALGKQDNYPQKLIVKKSIVLEFYIRRHKTFNSLHTLL